jgi:hypothetical protein
LVAVAFTPQSMADRRAIPRPPDPRQAHIQSR